MRYFLSCFVLVLIFIQAGSLPNMAYAQAPSKTMSDKEKEVRAVWISTVYNIDWPSRSGLTAAAQKKEFTDMLDKLHAMGINTVFVQVRGASDAIYPSKLVTWSRSLTGKEGKSPGYDPLSFMIEETHRRGMEFHAWFNPFRASTGGSIKELPQNHPAKQHPEWVVPHDKKLIFNPGIPEARQHIIDAIMEVVENYDIDGVHLDDYFYPYGEDTFQDDRTFAIYKGSMSNKAEWRRNNINAFVQDLHQEITAEKNEIDFGISPFGIWRNSRDDSTGSDTTGNSAYDSQYADARSWIRNEWIDYIAPQLYWSIGFKPAAYEKLVDWWAKETRGTSVKLYIGHGAYKLGSNTTDWKSSDAIIRQLQLNRKYPEVRGSIFFSAKTLLNNTAGIGNRLTQFYN
ncbi:Uncharacterized lipoprotein YddW, UPF0748 family [Paenibacillus algorifonticola]|uniref:Uncharacterized lipoprotein YddW, UPF0748 family n=1 Tax=Paenibacillus algorifonticola TaxID=684063 RepID=A0A1I2F7F2_9BACL|nr:Uncharacterized lipoprotein YddW, UPF0748 family [Paenibacillus algorifonticola]